MSGVDTHIPETVLARLPGEQEAAWVGFLVAHVEIMRALDAGLAEAFGLSVSALEVLARVAGEPDGRMRMSELAQGALLSASRVSRLIDQLETRGVVRRTSCPSDSRGVFAEITPAGRALTARALEWHWQEVGERFFSRLDQQQVSQLGFIWQAILGGPPEGNACTGG
jgi:DNA-binding MarR family transcriptional regulator